MNHCYCPKCNILTQYTKFDVIAERTVTRQENTIYGLRTVSYNEQYVSHQVDKCDECNSIQEFPKAQTRKQYFACVEQDHHMKNFVYPILGVAFIFISSPVCKFLWPLVSGFWLSALVVLIGIVIPVSILLAAGLYTSQQQKRKFKMCYSVLLSAGLGGVIGLILGGIISAFVPFIWLSSIISFSLTVSCAYFVAKDKVFSVKLLFELFDQEAAAEEFFYYYEEEKQREEQNHQNTNNSQENSSQHEQDGQHSNQNMICAAFKIFDLDISATEEDLKNKYRSKMKQFHPDRFQQFKTTQPEKYEEAVEVSKNINTANDILQQYFKNNKKNQSTAHAA